MYWFVAGDPKHYTKKGSENIISDYDIDDLVIFPTEKTFQEYIPRKSAPSFLAPYYPEEIFPTISSSSLFEIIILPNLSEDGIRTSLQEKNNLPIEKALSKTTGGDLFYATETLADYGGIPRLKEEVTLIELKQKYGIPTKGFLLAGIPGTGKSFFVKCVAGELGYMVVPLSISKIKAKPNAVEELSNFLKFFSKLKGKYLIWIDEIEKMLKGEASQEIIGELLTNLNELNSSGESSFFIIATANDVDDLAKSNPEFFRDGRFDAIFFLMNPEEKSADEIFEIYINKLQKLLENQIGLLAIYFYAKNIIESEKIPNSRCTAIAKDFYKIHDEKWSIEEIANMEKKDFLEKVENDKQLKDAIGNSILKYSFTFDIQMFIQASMENYRAEGTMQVGRYTYTPAEIMTLLTKLFNNLYLFNDEELDYYKIADGTKPLQMTIKDSIQRMLSRSSDFIVL